MNSLQWRSPPFIDLTTTLLSCHRLPRRFVLLSIWKLEPLPLLALSATGSSRLIESTKAPQEGVEIGLPPICEQHWKPTTTNPEVDSEAICQCLRTRAHCYRQDHQALEADRSPEPRYGASHLGIELVALNSSLLNSNDFIIVMDLGSSGGFPLKAAHRLSIHRGNVSCPLLTDAPPQAFKGGLYGSLQTACCFQAGPLCGRRTPFDKTYTAIAQ